MKKTVSSLVVTSCMTAFRKRVRLRRAGLGHLVDPFGGTLLNVACKPLYKSLSSTNLFGLTFYRTNHAPYMAKGHEASTQLRTQLEAIAGGPTSVVYPTSRTPWKRNFHTHRAPRPQHRRHSHSPSLPGQSVLQSGPWLLPGTAPIQAMKHAETRLTVILLRKVACS